MASGEVTYQLTDADEQFAILQKFTAARQPIRLRTPNLQEDFSTVILACDWLRQQLTLDEAVSPDKPFAWQAHPKIELDGSITGVHYQFHDLSVVDNEAAGSPGHLVTFPTIITYQQRRQAFRCAVPRALHSEIEFEINNTDINGRILDLSATGLACECKLEKPLNPKTVDQFNSEPVVISFKLEELLTVVCPANIIELIPDERTNTLRLGVEFFDVSPSVQRTLDKAIADLQRLTRKNQTR